MEWGKSLFIILVFVVLVGHVAASVGVKNIQENWPLYRCNPLIMPFAATFSPTPTTASANFSFCVNDNLQSFGPSLTQPLSYVQNVTLDLLGALTTSNKNSMKQSSDFSFSVSGMFTSIYQVILGIVGKFNLVIIKMMDAQGKIMGALVALMHIVTTVQYTFMSMWEGIPGTMIRTFSSLSKVKK
jgi:hypothetical protein